MTAIHRSFLVWRNGFYAKVAFALSVVTVLLYWLHRPGQPPNGGTWLGYAYGTIGLGLIVWLAWFGIRRRRYGRAGPLEDLLSAHVYLGLALIVVATLHTGFRFHWNVHTLAFALMVLVIASGIFGVYAFWRYPALITGNRGGVTLDALTAELATLDVRCRDLALNFSDDIVQLVASATDDTGGRLSLGELLRGRRPGTIQRPTFVAIERLQQEVGGGGGLTPGEILPLVQSLTQRLTIIERLRRDWRYRGLVLLWRAIHVPLTVALLVALSIHVFAVFYYW